jgi:GNAT superfamily N-acetyltransferase
MNVEPDEVIKKVETEMAGQSPDAIEAEINRRLMPGATRIFEDSTFDGKRMTSLFGPNDNMVVIQKEGKDAGFLWYERQPEGGFKTKKIEVKKEFQRQGLASQLQDKVEEIEGSYQGAATDLTPEGRAYQEGRQAKNKVRAETGYRPEVEGILGVPETAREGTQEAIRQKAQQMGLGPLDLQNVILAIEALKEN